MGRAGWRAAVGAAQAVLTGGVGLAQVALRQAVVAEQQVVVALVADRAARWRPVRDPCSAGRRRRGQHAQRHDPAAAAASTASVSSTTDCVVDMA